MPATQSRLSVGGSVASCGNASPPATLTVARRNENLALLGRESILVPIVVGNFLRARPLDRAWPARPFPVAPAGRLTCNAIGRGDGRSRLIPQLPLFSNGRLGRSPVFYYEGSATGRIATLSSRKDGALGKRESVSTCSGTDADDNRRADAGGNADFNRRSNRPPFRKARPRGGPSCARTFRHSQFSWDQTRVALFRMDIPVVCGAKSGGIWLAPRRNPTLSFRKDGAHGSNAALMGRPTAAFRGVDQTSIGHPMLFLSVGTPPRLLK